MKLMGFKSFEYIHTTSRSGLLSSFTRIQSVEKFLNLFELLTIRYFDMGLMCFESFGCLQTTSEHQYKVLSHGLDVLRKFRSSLNY